MQRYWLTRLADHVLISEVTRLVSYERQNTADLLAHLAEVDARKLYAPAGYDSMYAWCVGVLGFSEDMAADRIQVARVARAHPPVFGALASSDLHMSGVRLLSPHLTRENCVELLEAAARKSKAQIAEMLATRFPRPDLPTVMQVIGPMPALDFAATTHESRDGVLSVPERIKLARTEHVTAVPPPVSAPERMADLAKLTPLSSDRVGLQVTLARSTAEQLRYAQALLGHAIAPGDVAAVLDRAVKALVEQLEKRRFAKCARARATKRTSHDPRHIPAHVRREVFERDRGCCTFVSADGHACESRRDLEFDHHVPVARGGRATAANIRLRCSTHNQHAADVAFGAGFMAAKRNGTRVRRTVRGGHGARVAGAALEPMPALVPAAAESQALASAPAVTAATTPVAAPTDAATLAPANALTSDPVTDITNALRNLGARKEEVRHALDRTSHLADAPLEARLLAALRTLRPAGVKTLRPAAG